MAEKRVWLFREGNKDLKDLLGGKGANLAEMTRAGLPVPYGFTVTTATCWEYVEAGHKFPKGFWTMSRRPWPVGRSGRRRHSATPRNRLWVSAGRGPRSPFPAIWQTSRIRG